MSELVDVEALAIDFLLTQSAITDIAGQAIAQQLPAGRPNVMAFRLVGPGRHGPSLWLDPARLQVESRADERDVAYALATAVQAALLDGLPGAQPTGVVTDVEEFAPPFWLPDPVETPATPRYVATLAVFVHPLP